MGCPLMECTFASWLTIQGMTHTSFAVVASDVTDDRNQGVLTRDFLWKEPMCLISLSSE